MLKRMMMMTLLLLTPGCAYFSATPPLTEASGEEVVVADDLPVPEGFKLDKTASFKHERSSFRRYELTYRRTEYLSEERVREFVLKYMPLKGWVTKFVYGIEETKAILTKGDEQCLIHIFEDGSDRFTELQLRVQPRLTPEGGFVARQTKTVPASAKPAGTKTTKGLRSKQDRK